MPADLHSLTGDVALAGWCGLVEANLVGGRVDELHLSDVTGTWADARIEERISALVEPATADTAPGARICLDVSHWQTPRTQSWPRCGKPSSCTLPDSAKTASQSPIPQPWRQPLSLSTQPDRCLGPGAKVISSSVSRAPVGDHLGTTQHTYGRTTRRWPLVVSGRLNGSELRRRRLPRTGSRGRRFKSGRPDQKTQVREAPGFRSRGLF